MSRAGVDPSGTILRAYLDSDCYFDIVDDSDALLSPKYHLVYAVGNKKSLEGQWMFLDKRTKGNFTIMTQMHPRITQSFR